MKLGILSITAALSLAAPALAQEPERVHAAALAIDAHVDIPADFDGPLKPASAEGNGQFDLPKIERGGLRGAFLAVFAAQDSETPAYFEKARKTAEAAHERIAGLAARYPDKVERSLTPADFRRITQAGKFALIESISNGGAFVGGPDDIDLWAERGVRMFGLVHSGHNRLADSSRPAAVRGEGLARHGGLSPLGKQVVERLNRRGILIDVSQLSDAAFDDVLRLSRAPVIASHSNLRAVVDVSRNLSDAQLDALKANGGVVAINAFSAYLLPRSPEFVARFEALKAEFGIAGPGGGNLLPDRAKEYDRRYHELRAEEPHATVADLVDTVDRAVKRIGIRHVALSSDFNQGGGVTGWQDEGEAGNVTAELLRRGYKSEDIVRLWSGNILRIWAEAEKAASK